MCSKIVSEKQERITEFHPSAFVAPSPALPTLLGHQQKRQVEGDRNTHTHKVHGPGEDSRANDHEASQGGRQCICRISRILAPLQRIRRTTRVFRERRWLLDGTQDRGRFVGNLQQPIANGPRSGPHFVSNGSIESNMFIMRYFRRDTLSHHKLPSSPNVYVTFDLRPLPPVQCNSKTNDCLMRTAWITDIAHFNNTHSLTWSPTI